MAHIENLECPDPEPVQTDLFDHLIKYKVNITLKELERAVKFAKSEGISDSKTITLHFETSTSFGTTFKVSKDQNSPLLNFTDYSGR